MPFIRQKRNQKVVHENIVIEQGTTWSMTMDVTDTDGTSSFDLSSYSGRGELRKSFTSLDADAISFTVSVDSVNDQVTYSLTSVQTAALDVDDKYYYDVEIYDASSPPVVYRLVQGVARVSPEVTKS